MTALDEFAADVRAGLLRPGQKELPCKYFYDPVGTALFEAICLLPEYGLARAGSRLARRYAAALAQRVAPPVVVAELGSGTGRNTRPLLSALGGRAPVTYCPIDLSPSALAACREEVASAGITVVPIQETYLAGLAQASGRHLSDGQHMLVMFLGGTIGNFDRLAAESFLRDVRGRLRPGDSLLLAADLDKPAADLVAAYDDASGVTAAFNKNLLARINRELGADFDLSRFEHVARFDECERRIEMHLRSRVAQTVTVARAGLRVELRAGETIWTESSYRYGRAEIVEQGARAGFRCDEQWVDEEWPFAHTLLVAT